MNECPYKKTQSNISQFNKDSEEILNNNNSINMDQKTGGKCPFSSKNNEEKKEVKNKDKDKEINENNKDDSDDEQPQGGCPVMNKGKKQNLI
jgi:hypothetical protein